MRRGALLLVLVLLGFGIYWYFTDIIPERNAESKKISTSASVPTPPCNGKLTPQLTEGPYYKAGSPERTTIIESNTPGTNLIIKGYVFDQDCKPISNAWIDFWQTDGNGNYDNAGYKMRGHQYTDSTGFYRLETVVPGEYPGRTQHIHFKIRATENSPVITSQLFFPNTSQNTTDSIFDEALVIDIGDDPDGSKYGSYSFIVNK